MPRLFKSSVAVSERYLKIGSRTIAYIAKRTRRSKHLRLFIRPTGQLVLTRPFFVSLEAAEAFLRQQSDWLLKNLPKAPIVSEAERRQEYLAKKEVARRLVFSRLEYFNRFYNFSYRRVAIRNQASRWGSCSRSGGLNFNFRLLELPAGLRDYVIVHELCHLRELNHSVAFWSLVSQAIPDYQARRRTLKSWPGQVEELSI